MCLTWLATGRFDRDRACALGAKLIEQREEPWSSNFEAANVWFAFLQPSADARALLAIQRRRASRARGNDGDSREAAMAERAGVALVSAIVESWDAPAKREALPAAFQAYYAAVLDYWRVDEPFVATCVEAALCAPPGDPAAHVRRLAAFIREPLAGAARTNDPALRVLDELTTVLARGNGLAFVRVRGRIRAVAVPATPARDFI